MNENDRRTRVLNEVKAAVSALCDAYTEEDIIAALALHCAEVSEEIEGEGNNPDAASYWRGLAQRLEGVTR